MHGSAAAGGSAQELSARRENAAGQAAVAAMVRNAYAGLRPASAAAAAAGAQEAADTALRSMVAQAAARTNSNPMQPPVQEPGDGRVWRFCRGKDGNLGWFSVWLKQAQDMDDAAASAQAAKKRENRHGPAQQVTAQPALAAHGMHSPAAAPCASPAAREGQRTGVGLEKLSSAETQQLVNTRGSIVLSLDALAAAETQLTAQSFAAQVHDMRIKVSSCLQSV